MSTLYKTSMVFSALITLWRGSQTSYIYKTQHENVNKSISCIDSILDALEWNSVALLQDNYTEIRLRRKVISYDITSLSFQAIMQDLHRLMFPRIYVLVYVAPWNNQQLVSFMQNVDHFDEMSNRTTDFRGHSQWLMILTGGNSLTSELGLKKLKNVGVVFYHKDHSCGRFLSLRHHPSRSNFEVMPGCSPLYNSPNCVFPNTLFAFNNIKLRVAVLKSKKYTIKSIVNGTAVFSGFIIDILHLLEKALNFSSSLVEPDDEKTWGVLNGTWNGVIGQLQRREVDLAAVDLTETWDRSKVVDFLQPYLRQEGSVFLYRKLDGLETGLSLVFRPLQVDVYLALLGGCAVVSIMLVVLRCHGRCDREEALSTSYNVLAMLLKQGNSVDPDNCPMRFVLLSWWVVIIIVTSAYSATLVASLSDLSHKVQFNTLEEFVNSNFEAGSPLGSMYLSEIKKISGNVFTRLYNKMRSYHDANPALQHLHIPDLMPRLLSDRLGLIMYASLAEEYERKHWQLTHLKKTIMLERLAFAVPKGSPLRTNFENVLYDLKESGVLEELWKQWNGRQIVMSNRTDSREAITVYQMGGGFAAVAVGLGLALVALVWECHKHRGTNQFGKHPCTRTSPL